MGKNYETKSQVLTTENGVPIANQHELFDGLRGSALLQDVRLIEQMQHFNSGRISERLVYEKGLRAYGTFTVTSDLALYTKAKVSAVKRLGGHHS